MAHFQAVRSGITISQSIADMLERADPKQYNGANHAQTIREINDILQGRSELSFDMLYSILKQKCGEDMGRVEKIKRDVGAFQAQKSSRSEPYTLTGTQEYHYETWDCDPQRPLKIISQPLFDHAAEHGFPPDFFTASYFDNVTIYCMPDNVDCSFSQFQNCRFSVCGIRGAVFDNATLDDTDFHSALLQMVNFTGASIAHSHFRDCDMKSVSFQDTRMKNCLTLDCTLDRVDSWELCWMAAVMAGWPPAASRTSPAPPLHRAAQHGRKRSACGHPSSMSWVCPCSKSDSGPGLSARSGCASRKGRAGL